MEQQTGGLSLRTRMALLGIIAVVGLVVIGILVRVAYVDVASSTKAVQNATLDQRDAAIEGLAGVARRMAVALTVAGAAALALVASSFLLLRRWVLEPLDDLRRQLRGVARLGHTELVIVPTGPPELRAVGTDAESMRRALLAEADAARAAGEGLEQEGPVVAAIRADLATVDDPIAVGLEVHGRVEAAHGVLAGDWWGVLPLEDERTALLLVDVAGHGELAGLVLQRLRSVMTVALRSGLDPGTAMTRGAVSFTDAADGRFATALVAVVDPGAGTLSWANAGHPAGWLLPTGACDRRTTLAPTGPLLSSLGGAWTTRTAPFAPDDVLLVWSDGLVEARDASREMSDDDLARIVSSIPTREPRELVARVLADVRAQSPDWRRDDVTLVALRRVG
jgi:sigma-B regulation protein RsbU (phosphoserine phosphatase)